MGENGNKEKSVKEIDIDTSGASTKTKEKENSKVQEVNPDTQKEALIESLVSALRVGILNSTQHSENGAKVPNTPMAATEHPLSTQPIEAANHQTTVQPVEAANHQSTVQPIEAANHAATTQPEHAANDSEAKENPKTAGIAAETKNPVSAGVTEAPKSNYVPTNQIALLPISIPNSLLTQIQGALNVSAANKTGPPSLDFASLLGNTTTSTTAPKQEASLLATNETATADNNATVSHHTFDTEQAHNDSQLVDTATSSATTTTTPSVSSTNDTNVVAPVDEASLMKSPITQKQTVTACKRGGPCFTGKVVTEGTSMQALDDAKKKNQTQNTISISPSLLIQKLMEHTAAEQSTPDPVVNVVPGQKDEVKTTNAMAVQDDEQNNNNKQTKEIDINQLIKALTGITNNTRSNDSTSVVKSGVVKETPPMVQKDAQTAVISSDSGGGKDKKAAVGKDMSISTRNCTTTTNSNSTSVGVKRFALNFDCVDKHKGGTLSISPSELLQRLLGPKTKVELDKKTISNTHVVKTDKGIQLNFPLNTNTNTKDKIPADFSLKMTNPMGRQQHVDVLNTPKGMVVKPLKSLQLLTPLFVPVQNKDIVELKKVG